MLKTATGYEEIAIGPITKTFTKVAKIAAEQMHRNKQVSKPASTWSSQHLSSQFLSPVGPCRPVANAAGCAHTLDFGATPQCPSCSPNATVGRGAMMTASTLRAGKD